MIPWSIEQYHVFTETPDFRKIKPYTEKKSGLGGKELVESRYEMKFSACSLNLINPTMEYDEDIMQFRNEILGANDSDSFAGCGELRKCETTEKWLQILKERQSIDTCPAGGVTSNTYIAVRAEDIIGVRFNMHDWYIAFKAEYVSGEASSDNDENSEVLWVDVSEALSREDVPELTKKLIQSAISGEQGLNYKDYEGSTKHAPYSLYCL